MNNYVLRGETMTAPSTSNNTIMIARCYEIEGTFNINRYNCEWISFHLYNSSGSTVSIFDKATGEMIKIDGSGNHTIYGYIVDVHNNNSWSYGSALRVTISDNGASLYVTYDITCTYTEYGIEIPL